MAGVAPSVSFWGNPQNGVVFPFGFSAKPTKEGYPYQKKGTPKISGKLRKYSARVPVARRAAKKPLFIGKQQCLIETSHKS